MKKINVKNANGKYVVVSKEDFLKALPSIKAADNVMSLNGAQLIPNSVQLDENGVEAFDTENNSITPNEIIVTSIPPSALSAPFDFAVGASINVSFKENNTGAATITVGGGEPKAIQKDGEPLIADALEAGYEGRLTYDGVAFQVATDATIAAAKNVDAKLTKKANSNEVNGSFTTVDGKTVTVVAGMIAAIE